MNPIIILTIFLTAFACSSVHKTEQWKQEIVDTEKAFCEMANAKSIQDAFIAFAADSAIMLRGKNIIKGKTEFEDYFNRQNTVGHQLIWAPDFVDVSKSGDMAYTYGKYTYTYPDSLGNELKSEGIFHTVWKRQSDGNWKFVWD